MSVNSKESFEFFPSSFVRLPRFASIIIKKGLSSQKQFSRWARVCMKSKHIRNVRNEKCLEIIKIISSFFFLLGLGI